MNKLILAAATAALAMTVSGAANAAQLVTNGGFETGTFSGWTQSGNTGATYVANLSSYNYINSVDATEFSGNYVAALGPVGSTGSLTQILNTIVGDVYTISFGLANLGSPPSSFTATFGSDVITNQTNLAINELNFMGTTYVTPVEFISTFTATSDATPLTFTFRQDPSYVLLDNVSVTGATSAVPEPTTWAMMLLGFGMIGFAARARRRQNLNVTYA